MGNSPPTIVKEPIEHKITASPLEASPHSVHGHGKFRFSLEPLRDEKFRRRCFSCHKILFTIFAVLVILKALGLIIVVMMTSVANRVYGAGQSERVMAAAALACTAAVSISIAIYGLFGLYKEQKKPLYVTAIVLILMALVQTVIAGTVVNLTTEDEVNLSESLMESFVQSRGATSRQHLLWSSLQHDLKCCGVVGASDYASPLLPVYLPPNIPISCCPGHDNGRSDLVQEREREACKARREYYDVGCRELIVDAVKNAAWLVLSVIIGLVIIESISCLLGGILYRKLKSFESSEEETKEQI